MTTSVTVTKKDRGPHHVDVILVTPGAEGPVEQVFGTLVNEEDVCLVTVHSDQQVVVREKA